VAYIHLNSLRVGIVGDLKELKRYPYTGHAVLMGQQRVCGKDPGPGSAVPATAVRDNFETSRHQFFILYYPQITPITPIGLFF
jgi:hypothetical protein